MIHSGGRGFCRVLAFCLTCVLMLSACYVPAYGLDVWAETALNLFWTDEAGKIRIYPMTPVVMEAQRAYWVQADADAQGQTLYLEALCPDPAYTFYFLDDMGGHEAALTWHPEMDAATLDQGYAHYLWYSVDGVQADQPILLYVSSIPQPEEAPFVSYPVQVEVRYVTEDGTVLDTQSAECWAGESTPVWAGSRRTQGYTLISPDVVEVYVDEAGQASTDVVTFVYRANATPEPTEAPTATPVTEVTVPVVYYHVNGTQLDFQERVFAPGSHWVEASSAKTDGYVPVGDTSVQLNVYPDGTMDLASVVFYYDDPYQAPVEAEVVILYMLDDQSVIANESRLLLPGEHVIHPDSSRIGSYILAGEQTHTLFVDDQGYVIPEAAIAFRVRMPAAKVTVRYQDERGRNVAPDQTHAFTEDGDYTITATPEGMADVYELAPGLHSSVTVTVRNGVPSQREVYFYYQQKQAAPAMANVTVHYYDTQGNEIAPAKTIPLEKGQHDLRAEPEHLPAGYTLISDGAIRVEVFDNGTFAPQEVAFYYAKAQAETKKAVISILYLDDRGNPVAAAEQRELGNGTHMIQADPRDLPQGYEIFPGTRDSEEIIVRDGVPNRNQVVFYYQYMAPVQTQKKYTLPVYYHDAQHHEIASTQYIEVAPGTYPVQANPLDLPDGCELLMNAVQTIIVHEDGTTTPEQIVFYYSVPELLAQVTVSYVDEQNREIIAPFVLELEPGTHTIRADAARVPSGYDAASAQPATVQVTYAGKAAPDWVRLVFRRQTRETPIPVGAQVNRYAVINSSDVAFRNEPTTSGGKKTIIKRLGKNNRVFVLEELYNDKNEVWAMVNVDGRIGYMMSSFLDIMTQQASDAYSAQGTPVPTLTPVPAVTERPTPTPTATPTLEPIETPDDSLVEIITPPPADPPTLEPLPGSSATPTASPAPYAGYALTTRVTALRTGVSTSDMSIIQQLEANELVYVADQVKDPATGAAWSIVSTLAGQPGYVPFSALRPITAKEAQPYLDYWQEVNKSPAPTQISVPTAEPMQISGYGVVIGDGVPFRQMQSEFSRIIDHLDANTVVYVTGQTPGDGQYWHSVNYQNHWGYIRTDLVRMMTIAEEEKYLRAQQATATPATTNRPFDSAGLSSYGYVDASSVNWRQSPSVKAKNVEGRSELKRYAFCLVLDTEYVSGVTWYLISYGDKTGYVHGDFFKQMSITELEHFLGSDEYLQGVSANSASGDQAMDDVGYTGTGGIVSWEDQWVSNNQDAYASFAPFNPIGTVAPIATSIPTLEPLPGWVTNAPTATPSPTPNFNPMPDVTYPTADNGDGGSTVLWVVVMSLLLLAVGGVFVLVRHNQNRRRIAMRAAQRRAQAARAQQMQQRPYARTANPSQPRTGMYQQNVQRPSMQPQEQQNPAYTPFAGAGYTGTFRQQNIGERSATEQPQRVGRRTAYRQAQEAARQTQDDTDLNM